MKTILAFSALLWAMSLQAQTYNSDTLIFTVVEEMPEYPGGEKELMNFLGSIEYPKEAMDNNIEGSVYLRFIIEKDGSVGGIEVAKGSRSFILDQAAIDHVKKMPQWKPGRQNGKVVRVQYIVPIKFTLTGGEVPPAEKQAQTDNSGSQIFAVVETMPQFPGGEKELLNYLGTIKYPQVAIDSNFEGNAYVLFVIEKDGSIGDAEVQRSSGSTILDEAAVAHVKKMPSWEPGRQNGKAVRVKYIVPIRFALADSQSPADKKKKRN